jgi:heptaprenyl diphosphate synthase
MAAKLPRQVRGISDRDLVKRLESGLERVEARLASATSVTDPLATKTVNHLILAGGKRIRPVLVLLTAGLGDAEADAVIDAATVAELTHLATLYHDDVMDEAPTRRGVKTAHEIWGNNVAILTGDLLFAKASQLVARMGEKALALQADTFERLCLGQLHETVGPAAGEDPIEHYIQVLADKTGSLLATSAELGVIHSGADHAWREPVREFGEKIGVAFQLIDDLIDLQDSARGSGKTAGTDLRAQVATYPVLLLRKLAKNDAEAAGLLRLIDGDLTSDETLAHVVGRLREHPVTAATYDEARRWAAAAIAALAPLPEGQVKGALAKFAEAVVEREQ